MRENDRREKKKTSWGTIVLALFFGLFWLVDEIPDELLGILAVMLLLLIPVGIVAAVAAAVRKRKPASHSHDRIDHSRDLKINPKTGTVIRTPEGKTAQHSPQEHWKQQLDGLLANGTIDRSEYRAMLKRKF